MVILYRKPSTTKINLLRSKTKEKTEKVQFPNYLSLTSLPLYLMK